MDFVKLERLRKKAAQLPKEPGVYLMRDHTGKIIYIGKAKALRNRVSSYFRSVEKHTDKVYKMVENAEDFETIVTDTEFEALVLECSLIKQHTPKYNILLKDDKGYSYIRISPPPFSKITAVLQREQDDAVYLGPYISSFVVKQTVEETNKIFLLPTCSRKFPQDFKKGRPCLNYHIKQCMGVCRGRISQAEYDTRLREAVDFIKGGSVGAVQRLEEEMQKASEALDFEKAAIYRDRIQAIRKITERQKVVSSKIKDADYVAFTKSESATSAAILVFRGHRLVDKKDFLFYESGDMSAFARSFLLGYYQSDIPKRIVVDEEFEDLPLTEEYFSQKAGKKVQISVPQRGEALSLVQMAKNNAAQRLSHEMSRGGRELTALDDLSRLLGLSAPPAYIEAYDISNIGSGTIVGGMTVFENGKPAKKYYKRFLMKDQLMPDDYASMREMLSRRLDRYEAEKHTEEGFGKLPELILIDGGKGHVSAVLPLVQERGLSIPVFGMVKDSKHRTRAVAKDGGEIAISANKNAFSLVTRIQDETHRFTIEYSRSKHRKTGMELAMTQVPGIGPGRAKALFAHFKTQKSMREATEEELAKVKGMNKNAAQALYAWLHQESSQG